MKLINELERVHLHLKLTPGQLETRYMQLKRSYGVEFAKGFEFAYKHGIYVRGFTENYNDSKGLMRVYFEIFDCGDTELAKAVVKPILNNYFKVKKYDLFRINNSQPIFYAQFKDGR